jgi:YfiH family protein
MPYKTVNGLEFFTFASLCDANVKHGIFTRKGGISPKPWSSLNLGGTVGDSRENVVENRRRIFEIIGKPVESIYDAWQVHSTEVICTESPRPLDKLHQKGDAIITNQSGITLFMRFADCVPILLYDPVNTVIGIAHAGWKGTVTKVAARTVEVMQENYGTNPAEILACIGPSIGPHHYQVGEEVVAEVNQAFGEHAVRLLSNSHQFTYFDLWSANAWQLKQTGVKSIEVAGICTACDLERWYSHRAENGKTGRFGAFIVI